eukprot:SAG11_NODE_8563_length_1000_cov_1.245283_1_plen_231_part_01
MQACIVASITRPSHTCPKSTDWSRIHGMKCHKESTFALTFLEQRLRLNFTECLGSRASYSKFRSEILFDYSRGSAVSTVIHILASCRIFDIRNGFVRAFCRGSNKTCINMRASDTQTETETEAETAADILRNIFFGRFTVTHVQAHTHTHAHYFFAWSFFHLICCILLMLSQSSGAPSGFSLPPSFGVEGAPAGGGAPGGGVSDGGAVGGGAAGAPAAAAFCFCSPFHLTC